MSGIRAPQSGVKVGARKCEIEGCDRVHHARGLCRFHDQRRRRYGDPLQSRAKPLARDSRCTVEGCDRRPRAFGLCAAHHSRWRRHGSALAPYVRVPWTPREDVTVLAIDSERHASGRLRNGYLDDVAQVLGRSKGAVRERLRVLLARRDDEAD